MSEAKKISLLYFAIFRDLAGKREESLTCQASSPHDLYQELQTRYAFPAFGEHLKVAINNEFAAWHDTIQDGDTIAFIAPVAGG